MPKWGVHYLIAKKSIEKLNNEQSLPIENKKALSEIRSNESIYYIGAVGPDMLFFAPDYKSSDKIYQLYKNIDNLLGIWEDIIEPIKEVENFVDEKVDSIEDSLDSQAIELAETYYGEIKETSKLFKSTVETGLFEGVVSGFDFISDHSRLPSVTNKLFEQFVPPAQKNEPVDKWYWFDMLHYRNTGEFARNLIEASSTPEEKAFSYGYLTHVAGDLVGHSYVNQVVGGPYRTHVQRHVVMENFMDTWSVFREDGSSVNKTLFGKLGLDGQKSLPDSVANLLSSATRQTYDDKPHPKRLSNNGFMSSSDFHDTFDKFRLVNKISRNMHVEPPTEPFDGASNLLEEALSDLTDAPPSPPSPSSSSANCGPGDYLSFGATAQSRECYEEAYESMKKWAEYFKEFYEWALKTLIDIIDLIVTALAYLPAKVILALNYRLQLLIYNFYSNLRFELSLYGYVTPEVHAVNSGHMNIVTTHQTPKKEVYEYPHLKSIDDTHLSFPNSGVEEPDTVPDFYRKGDIGVRPKSFIEDEPFDKSALVRYAKAESPEDTIDIQNDGARIGNSVDLSKWHIKVASNESNYTGDEVDSVFADWNLSSDRGYGFKCWSGYVPDISSKDDVSIESLSYE